MSIREHNWKPGNYVKGIFRTCEICGVDWDEIEGPNTNWFGHCDPIAEAIIKENNKEGLKFDQDKIRFELIPPYAELELAKVLTHGAKKYGPRNWMLVDNHTDRYLGACRRHLSAYMRGEKVDPESGINHLAHAVCSLMFILEKDLDATETKI